MSYNIDSWEQIGGGKLRISKKSAKRLQRKFGDHRPESWCVDDLKFGDDGYAEVDLSIHGEGSGHFFHDHMADVAKALEGEADFVLTWEGGDSHSGIRIRDGKAFQMDVVFALQEGSESPTESSR